MFLNLNTEEYEAMPGPQMIPERAVSVLIHDEENAYAVPYSKAIVIPPGIINIISISKEKVSEVMVPFARPKVIVMQYEWKQQAAVYFGYRSDSLNECVVICQKTSNNE